MNRYQLNIQNLKCGGCANTITNGALKIKGITNVVVDENESSISFDAENDDQITELTNKLAFLGYPISGEDNSTFRKAKSYVSCMIGRVNK